MEKRPLFFEDEIYHVYNRGNGHDNTFRNPGNFEYFMKQYDHYMSIHWDTLAWCLMPNHFHLVVKVREHRDKENVNRQCVKSFADFINGYVQAFNKQHHRRGSLFMRSFKRKHVSDEEYLKTLTCYIHNNPVKDGLMPAPETWLFSSYRELRESSPFKYQTDPLLKVFGSREEFVQQHIIHRSPGRLDIPYMAA